MKPLPKKRLLLHKKQRKDIREQIRKLREMAAGIGFGGVSRVPFSEPNMPNIKSVKVPPEESLAAATTREKGRKWRRKL